VIEYVVNELRDSTKAKTCEHRKKVLTLSTVFLFCLLLFCQWGFFERESFEKVYGSIKQELYKAVGYEEAPKMRRRRPMMDKMRLRARLEEELAGRTEDPMVKFSAEDPGDPGRQDSSEPEKESVSKQDETPEEPSRTIPAAASSSLDKHLAADVEDYEAYDIYDDDDSDE